MSAPDGAVIIGLFGQSWRADLGDWAEMRLDPWTGTVIGFAEK